jgi:serine/threonine protein kinase
MSGLNDFYNNEYIELQRLSTHNMVYLVKNIHTGQLYVRRRVASDQLRLFIKLKNIHNVHIPYIEKIDASDSETIYIYEQYIEGRTMQSILLESGSLPESVAVNYVLQLCEALSDIHSNDIVHRDIKPENIVIDESDVLHLIDFDISRINDSEKSSDTVIMGTEGYAAPEQFGFRRSDNRADIFACGVLMHVMLTGMLPNKAADAGISPPDAYKAVIRKCINLEPGLRYSNVNEMKSAILDIAGGQKHTLKNRAAAYKVNVIDMLSKYHIPQYKKKPPDIAPEIPGIHISWRYLPGFRTGKLWKKIIMSIFYICVFLAFADMFYGCLVTSESLAESIILMLVTSMVFIDITGMYMIVFNVFNIHSCIKILKSSDSRILRLLKYCLILFIWYIVCAFVLLLIVAAGSFFMEVPS